MSVIKKDLKNSNKSFRGDRLPKLEIAEAPKGTMLAQS